MKHLNKIVGVLLVIIPSFIYLSYYANSFKKEKKEYKENKEITINVKNENYELEEYILGVVACEMPASYNEEALKAQAVAARTFAMYQKNKNPNYKFNGDTTDQCFFDINKMKEKWGNTFEKYYKKLLNIVRDTQSEVMLKDDNLFKSYYFSTTNGYTEDSMTVFKENGLTSVESLFDKESKDYERTVIFTYKELTKILGDFKDIKITKRNKTNRVDEVKVDDKVYSGVAFRKLLSLRSTDFIINIKNGKYEITTYGYGHGVGMSQDGANYLSKNKNYSYLDILKYYYGNVTLKKL